MLTLTRKPQEEVVINHSWRVIVLGIRGDKVRLGLDFPRAWAVHRKEIESLVEDAEFIDVDDLLAELESTNARLRLLETKVMHGCTDYHCEECDGGES